MEMKEISHHLTFGNLEQWRNSIQSRGAEWSIQPAKIWPCAWHSREKMNKFCELNLNCSSFYHYLGNGLVMVSQSNLATIRNSVTIMDRMTQDWRPNVSQFLFSKFALKMSWNVPSTLPNLLTDRPSIETFPVNPLHPRKVWGKVALNWANGPEEPKVRILSRMCWVLPAKTKQKQNHFVDFPRSNYVQLRSATYQENDGQCCAPPAKCRQWSPFKLDPIIRAELSNHSLQFASVRKRYRVKSQVW